jgi:hypothetical protein
MRITISERLRPYIRRAGAAMLIPGTRLVAFVYPNRLVVCDPFQGDQVAELDLCVHGPVGDFTVQQDLERARVVVWGETTSGYLRYCLLPLAGGLGARLVVEKGPDGFLGGKRELLIGEEGEVADVGTAERLFLGVTKQLEWDRVRQRADLCEILPVWHRLGLLTPGGNGVPDEPCLFHSPEASLLDVFQAGFRGLLTPSAQDTLHQGFPLPPLPLGSDPTVLLVEGARRIRALFVREKGKVLALRPGFTSGRMTGVTCGFGTLDFEWTKKSLRRALLHVHADAEVRLELHPDLKSFRLRVGSEERLLDAGTPFDVSQGQLIRLDRFQK